MARRIYDIIFILVFLSLFYPLSSLGFSTVDSQGREIILEKKPSRVVSLVPGITEIIMGLGAGDSLCGITYHSTNLPGAEHKTVVGGFLSPNPDLVEEIRPDVIFHAGLQKAIIKRFSSSACKLINLEIMSLEDSYDTILLMGRIFGTEEKAESLVRDIRDQLALIKKKVDTIPGDKRKRVMRLMDMDPVLTVGDDSFQNEMIMAAGGIPPTLNKKGLITNLAPFELWCRSIAGQVAGKKIDNIKDLIGQQDIPLVIRMSLNALMNGLYYRDHTKIQ